MPNKYLITGCCGFIGHHLVEHILINDPQGEVIGVDKLTYASRGFERLRDTGCLDNPRLRVFCTDFSKSIPDGVIREMGEVDYIFHLGAETHVDNSIVDPWLFVESNVIGTFHLLEFARKLTKLKRFFYFSTDEVFGPAIEGIEYKEWDRYNATNPYSATKAGGEQLAFCYANTFKIPVVVTRTMNCFGERQHPEKFIPKTMNQIRKGETVLIHSDASKRKAGSRSYIHCRNVASALLFLLDRSRLREAYHIVGEQEVNNLAMAQYIAIVMDKELKYEMIDFHSNRPGHDLRYALDGTRMRKIGWEVPKTFALSLEKTVKWTLANPQWLDWRTEDGSS